MISLLLFLTNNIGLPAINDGITSPDFKNSCTKPTNNHPSVKTVSHSFSQNSWSVYDFAGKPKIVLMFLGFLILIKFLLLDILFFLIVF